jgi:hypothetical protein
MGSDSPRPTFEELADLAEGRLTADEARRVHERLAASPDAAGDAAWLARALALMRADDGEDAPLWVVARAARLVRQPRAAPALDDRPAWRRVVAALVFDSAATAPAFGVRSGGAAARQLLYQGGEVDLDLRVAPEGRTWRVTGQVLGAVTKGRVALAGPGGEREQPLDALGAFDFGPVAAGAYRLALETDAARVEVPDLPVGEAGS